MRIRKVPGPQVLVAGVLEDRGRFLFITRKTGEAETLELPHAIIPQGADPVSALAEVFRSQFGIDAQVHGVINERTHNAGSRKRKRWIPVLAFRITTKNARARTGPEQGYVWLSMDEARTRKLARNAEWIL